MCCVPLGEFRLYYPSIFWTFVAKILFDIYFADTIIQLQLEAAKVLKIATGPYTQSTTQIPPISQSQPSLIKDPKDRKRRLTRWDSPPKRPKLKVSKCCRLIGTARMSSKQSTVIQALKKIQ